MATVSGDVKSLGTELLGEFVSALTPEAFQQGYRLGDVLCQGDRAEAFNEALARENKSPLHMICVGYALSQEGKKTLAASQATASWISPWVDRQPQKTPEQRAKFNQD